MAPVHTEPIGRGAQRRVWLRVDFEEDVTANGFELDSAPGPGGRAAGEDSDAALDPVDSEFALSVLSTNDSDFKLIFLVDCHVSSQERWPARLII